MKYLCPQCNLKHSTNDIKTHISGYLTYICPKCKGYFYFSPRNMCKSALLYALSLGVFWCIYYSVIKIADLNNNILLLMILLCFISLLTVLILSKKNSCLVFIKEKPKAVSVIKSGLSFGFFIYIVLECIIGAHFILIFFNRHIFMPIVFILLIPCLPMLLLGILSSFLHKLAWQFNRKLSK